MGPTTTTPKPDNEDVCRYECESNGGCSVRYTGVPRPGANQGSCFPEDFGGSCSGTPPECMDCNQVLGSCNCEAGYYCVNIDSCPYYTTNYDILIGLRKGSDEYNALL